MPRKLRVEYPGAVYPVMSRGDRCENIDIDDVDRQDFLKPLAAACQKAGMPPVYPSDSVHILLIWFSGLQGLIRRLCFT